MEIHVTEGDIMEARGHKERGWPTTCPIALALKRKRGITWASVSRTEASVSRGSMEVITYELPPVGNEFVKRFDGGLSVKPLRLHAKRTGSY